MNFCPNCGHDLKVRKASSHVPVIDHPADATPATPATTLEKAAQASLEVKLRELAPRFHGMSDEEFGDWVDALDRAEFGEFIGLGNDGIANLINKALVSAA